MPDRAGYSRSTPEPHVTGVERRHHEHHGEVSRGGTDGGGCNDERRNGDVQRQRDVELTLAGAIGMPGVGEGANDGETVGSRGEEQGLDVAVV